MKSLKKLCVESLIKHSIFLDKNKVAADLIDKVETEKLNKLNPQELLDRCLEDETIALHVLSTYSLNKKFGAAGIRELGPLNGESYPPLPELSVRRYFSKEYLSNKANHDTEYRNDGLGYYIFNFLKSHKSVWDIAKESAHFINRLEPPHVTYIDSKFSGEIKPKF